MAATTGVAAASRVRRLAGHAFNAADRSLSAD
jgi:hypothetical protein